MEFNEKLQKLRKQKGLTQEELAEALYVSRTAISKWESSRGYPSIDSLKAISQYFSVTIDDLLSGAEVLTIAEEHQKQKDTHFRDLVFGLLDSSVALLFLLPLFGQGHGGAIEGVSLLALTGVQPYLKATYMIAVVGMLLWGILTLALQTCNSPLWNRIKTCGTLVWNLLAALLFILGRQPYGAVFVLVFLTIKAFILFKHG